MALSISIWSDIACPWCFVGKARLESALDILAKEHNIVDVNIRWRAYELAPSFDVKTDVKTALKDQGSYVERIAVKYKISVPEAQAKVGVMADAVRASGGDCDLDKLVQANTFNAHRLVKWAASVGPQGRVDSAPSRLKESFMRGYLGHGLDLNSHQSMLKVVEQLGLDALAAGKVLESDDYVQAVRDDEQQAQSHGISGVPFFVIGRYGVSGAQEVSTLVDAIKQVNSE